MKVETVYVKCPRCGWLATELWFPGVKEGRPSGFGTGDYKVSAELDGIDICYQGSDAE